MEKKLIRVDRNGTKYYQTTEKCWKCNGTGFIKSYVQIYGGVCFECDGKGILVSEEKEYTPEYARKLERRRQAKAEAKREREKPMVAQKKADWLTRNGWENGKTYMVMGDTYSVKEDLKADGAKYDGYLGWHLPRNDGKWDVVEVNQSDVLAEGYDTYYYTDERGTVLKNLKEAWKQANVPQSEYVGEEGERITVKVISGKEFSYTTKSFKGWGTDLHLVYIFTDEDGNQFKYNTTGSGFSYEDLKRADQITGTVKGHEEYKGVKQTVLTRVRIGRSK